MAPSDAAVLFRRHLDVCFTSNSGIRRELIAPRVTSRSAVSFGRCVDRAGAKSASQSRRASRQGCGFGSESNSPFSKTSTHWGSCPLGSRRAECLRPSSAISKRLNWISVPRRMMRRRSWRERVHAGNTQIAQSDHRLNTLQAIVERQIPHGFVIGNPSIIDPGLSARRRFGYLSSTFRSLARRIVRSEVEGAVCISARELPTLRGVWGAWARTRWKSSEARWKGVGIAAGTASVGINWRWKGVGRVQSSLPARR